jgi:hypothetical protein
MAKPDSGACEPAATPGRTPRTTTRAGFGRTAQQAGRQPAPGRQATQARPPWTAASWGQCSLACAREPLSQGNPGRLGGGGMALILPGTPACQPCTAGPGRAFSADGRARPNPALAGRCERELMHDNAKASYDKLPNPGHRPRRTGLGQLMSPRRERPGDGTDRVRIGAEEPARWPDIAWGCQLRLQGRTVNVFDARVYAIRRRAVPMAKASSAMRYKSAVALSRPSPADADRQAAGRAGVGQDLH